MTHKGLLDAIAVVGSQRAFAEKLGVSQPAVNFWVQRGFVPVERVVEVEALTGISRMELADPRYVELLRHPFA